MFTGGMMLTCAGAANVVHRNSPSMTVCLASRPNTDQLRDQLDQLHFEASNTRSKANKARQRLLRLSEAAEKLQRQAAMCVQSGKENDARDLLFQKKKTMQALEKTKSRIDLLDELSTKLIEAISLRESQLVGTVALDSKFETQEASAPIHVVSPPSSNKDLLDSRDDQQPQDKTKYETNDLEELLKAHVENNDNGLIGSLKGINSYQELFENIDQNLDQVEGQLVTALKFSALILEGVEREKNLKVQQMVEILDAVKRVRERIAVIVQTEAEMK